MSSVVHNRKSGRGQRLGLALLPVALLPICAMGVAAKPAFEYSRAVERRAEAEERMATAVRLRRQLDAIGSLEAELQRLDELDQALTGLIPGELSNVTVYSYVRQAAEQLGFSARNVRVSDAEAFDSTQSGVTIGRRAVVLTGTSTRESAVGLIDLLRQWGLPTAVERYTLARERSSNLFSVELELGVFHNIPASSNDLLEESPLPGAETDS